MGRSLGILYIRIKSLIKSNKVLLRIYNYICGLFYVKSHIDYLEIGYSHYIEKKTKKTSIIPDNNYWGLDYLLEKFCLSNEDTYIEHGLYLDSYVKDDVYLFPNIKTIVTLCYYRETMLKLGGWNGNILNVGCYINHFSHEYPVMFGGEKIGSIQGRALLFTPHSIKGMDKVLNRDTFATTVDKLSALHPEVWLALFWDYPGEYFRLNYPKNVKLVTAGSRYDNTFLYRLKSIIELCHITYSFEVGTHVVYSLSLDRDHVILNGNISHRVKSFSGERELDRIVLNSMLMDRNASNDIFNACSEGRNLNDKRKLLKNYLE